MVRLGLIGNPFNRVTSFFYRHSEQVVDINEILIRVTMFC